MNPLEVTRPHFITRRLVDSIGPGGLPPSREISLSFHELREFAKEAVPP